MLEIKKAAEATCRDGTRIFVCGGGLFTAFVVEAEKPSDTVVSDIAVATFFDNVVRSSISHFFMGPIFLWNVHPPLVFEAFFG